MVSPVRLQAVPGSGQPDVTPALQQLYRDFESELLIPLWTEIGDLMPAHPRSRATPHLWRWDALQRLAAQAGALVPVGRGGERRANALANPSLGGRPFATPTLWAAIQYLLPGEDAPEHRHTQHAFRFVVEGSGVWIMFLTSAAALIMVAAAAMFCMVPVWGWIASIILEILAFLAVLFGHIAAQNDSGDPKDANPEIGDLNPAQGNGIGEASVLYVYGTHVFDGSDGTTFTADLDIVEP